MAVVFALLVVLVIGVGVAIAVRNPGAGALSEPGPVGSVTTVPAAGPLTAADVRAARFPIVFRGYRPAEVDALLERLERQLAGGGAEPAAGGALAPSPESVPPPVPGSRLETSTPISDQHGDAPGRPESP